MEQHDSQDRLFAPEIVLDQAKERAFAQVYAAALAADPPVVDYRLPYPKYEFLEYLVTQEPVLLHGSNDMAIRTFQPRRTSLDSNAHGSLAAIYATADSIWPIFFATLKRAGYKGSLRNGVGWDHDPAGVRRKVYQFSLNQEMLGQFPWTQGVIYVLPRATFVQLQDDAGDLTAEWAGNTAVEPLAMVPVGPEDFPFLDQVRGHDDTSILRLSDLTETLFKGCDSARELSDGYVLGYRDSATWIPFLNEFVELWQTVYQWATVDIRQDTQHGPVWLAIQGSTNILAVLKHHHGEEIPADAMNAEL